MGGRRAREGMSAGSKMSGGVPCHTPEEDGDADGPRNTIHWVEQTSSGRVDVEVAAEAAPRRRNIRLRTSVAHVSGGDRARVTLMQVDGCSRRMSGPTRS